MAKLRLGHRGCVCQGAPGVCAGRGGPRDQEGTGIDQQMANIGWSIRPIPVAMNSIRPCFLSETELVSFARLRVECH